MDYRPTQTSLTLLRITLSLTAKWELHRQHKIRRPIISLTKMQFKISNLIRPIPYRHGIINHKPTKIFILQQCNYNLN